MNKLLLTLCMVGLLSTANAQDKGDWYVGTGDISNVAWTEWNVSPTVGYGFTDNLMVGMSVSQEDSTQDVDIDLHARYFHKGYFAYVATDGLNTDNLNVGVGRMFNIKDWVYVDPKVVYNTTDETLNLMFGFGLKF